MTMVQYLLPIATGDPDVIPNDSDVMAVDPLSLDDPYSLALRRNRNILNPKKEHASKGRVKMKTSRSRSGSSNAIRELFTFAPSQPSVGEQPTVDGMRAVVSVSTMSSYSGGNDGSGSVDNEVVQSTLRRSKSKGSMSNLRDALASTFGKKKA